MVYSVWVNTTCNLLFRFLTFTVAKFNCCRLWLLQKVNCLRMLIMQQLIILPFPQSNVNDLHLTVHQVRKYIFNSIQVLYPFSDWGRGVGGGFAPMDFTFITFLLYEFKATKYRTFSKSFPGTIWCSKTLFIKFVVNKANTFWQAIFFNNFEFFQRILEQLILITFFGQI